MRSFVSGLMLAGAVVASSGAAQAADYGYGGYSEPSSGYSAATGAQNWSGFYLGAHLGAGFGDVNGADNDGVLIGIQGGSNWQYNQFLVGLEADVSATNAGYDGFADSYDMDWLGTIRGRVGFVFDRFVAYGTGGFAWAKAEYDDGIVKDSNTHAGWALGAGLEAALTEKVSVKGEYLYMDFGSESYAGAGQIEPNLHTVKVGMNYRF